MEVTEITASEFRSHYPEFEDDYTWIDETLMRFLTEADEETNSSRWGSYGTTNRTLKRRGMFAYAAHKLVLNSNIIAAVANGAVPSPAAQVQSKGVGDENVLYAVTAPTGLEATQLGDLRSTVYGQEFLRLRNRAGMGCAAV